MSSSVFLFFTYIKSHAVIHHSDDHRTVCLPAPDCQTASSLLLSDAVSHRIFHNRLQSQRRQHKVLVSDLPSDAEALSITHFLQIQIIFNMVQFFFKWNQPRIGKGIQISTQIVRKMFQRVRCSLWIRIAELLDANQRIIKEMRLNLRKHDGYAAL